MKKPKVGMRGKLLELTVTPGEKLLGLMVITASGDQEGRYMRNPESTYGSITINGKGVGSTAILIEMIQRDEYMVDWKDELRVAFTTEKKATKK